MGDRKNDNRLFCFCVIKGVNGVYIEKGVLEWENKGDFLTGV